MWTELQQKFLEVKELKNDYIKKKTNIYFKYVVVCMIAAAPLGFIVSQISSYHSLSLIILLLDILAMSVFCICAIELPHSDFFPNFRRKQSNKDVLEQKEEEIYTMLQEIEFQKQLLTSLNALGYTEGVNSFDVNDLKKCFATKNYPEAYEKLEKITKKIIQATDTKKMIDSYEEEIGLKSQEEKEINAQPFNKLSTFLKKL